jgi:hypothetical protein
MPSVWRIRRVKGSYYLYHEDKYVGPLKKIVDVWSSWRARGDLNPGPPAPKAGALSWLGYGPLLHLLI